MEKKTARTTRWKAMYRIDIQITGRPASPIAHPTRRQCK